MTSEERKRLIEDVKRLIWNELSGTIPPSIDLMRDFKFREAAEKSVDLCLERAKIELVK